MARSCVSVRRRRAFRCVYGIKRARSGLTMGDSATDRENRAPRKHRHHQENDLSSERNIHKPHNKHMQENDQYSKQYHNERTPSRNKQERSRNSYPERDQMCEEKKSQTWSEQREKYYREKEASRNQQERSQGRYDDKDGYYKERGQDRSQKDMSQKQYLEKENYHKETEKGRRNTEKSQNDYHERDEYRENYSYNKDRHQYPMDSKEQERYYADQRTFSVHGSNMEYVEEHETDGGILDCHKCRYLCTSRGILHILEVILNVLVLIFVVSSYFVLSGFSAGMSSGGFGGGYYPFEGQELQEVRQLDQQFTVMRAPLLYGGLTVSVLVGALTMGILAAGSKHLLSLSSLYLLMEVLFCTLASLGYGTALGVFLHFALQINSTDVCKRRERLYARNGLTWMNCDLAGTDGGAAAFAIILVILYAVSVVLAGRAYRQRKLLQRQRPFFPPAAEITF
ncbi:MARVEL domain-containing protein 3 isoform X1 [Xenopus tropicalis]|uniref:MARVEL domain-containing 3 n=2 Tax=Xenopus tropicalis TaxID=8364 RepID=A0A6I8Q4V4_XENTR|nr:MARVEL domain-containing protein 3 isoform X1 [Xenopus tropicalis]